MLISPAYAQAAGSAGSAGFVQTLIFMVALFAIMYFLMIRPQQKRLKAHREMIAGLRRGDTVVTGGGLIGKVIRVTDDELQVELAENVRVKVVKGTIQDVRAKGEPVANDSDKK
jgi:preprotein translocase subunit YajC